MLRKTREIIRRYVSTETPIIIPKTSAFNSVALVYPNSYFIGMSNLGFQSVYEMLNERADTLCERAFLFETDESFALESRRPLRDFDIIAFSVSFEGDFANIPKILKSAGIPEMAEERSEKDPIIVAGGACSFINPEPISDFIDIFLAGDAEGLLDKIMDIYSEVKFDKKEDIIERFSRIEGIYAPSVHRAMIPSGLRVRRHMLNDLNTYETLSSIIARETEFSGKFLIEVSRGCPRGCRFCAARYVYGKTRNRDIDKLKKMIDEGLSVTNNIGLVGASVSDYPHIDELCGYLNEKSARISVSSLRADSAGEVLLKSLVLSGQRAVTVAPEAGSDRLRSVINKGLDGNQIIRMAELSKKCGIKELKLYYMFGLPTEKDEDLAAMVNEALVIAEILPVTVNVSPFVPKPHTPFQWCAMNDADTLSEKLASIKSGLRKNRRIDVSGEGIKNSVTEAVLSRGDRGLSGLLREDNKKELLKSKSPFNKIPVDKTLPWDFVDNHVDKEFLVKEYLEVTRNQ